MGQWRGKLLLMLIVYAAGFATALYVPAPAEQTAVCGADGVGSETQDRTARDGFKAHPWAASAKAGMDQAFSFAEEQALRLAETMKSQLARSTPDSGD